MGAVGGEATTTCPQCKKAVRRATERAAGPDPYPFCTARCQLVDLGAWLDEDYRIPEGEGEGGAA